MADYINAGIDKYFPGKDMTFISEPGRYFVASAFTLICHVYSVKWNVERNNRMYFINNSIFASFNGLQTGHMAKSPTPTPIMVNA